MMDLAELVGYEKNYFSLLERGQKRIDDETAVKIALALELDPMHVLLAGLKERLPTRFRSYVPTQLDGEVEGARYATTREFQAEHFEFESKRVRINATADWQGNLTIKRTLEEIRPTSTQRPVSQMFFRERCLGGES